MDELIFVRPSAEMKEAAMAFRAEFIREKSKMNGSAGFLSYEDYDEWLRDLDLIERGEKEGRLASTVLFALNRETGEIVGIADIRHKLVPGHDHLPSYVNGHLGGSVRPSMRNQGYAGQMLAMSVRKAAEYGNTSILVSCDKWNTASERVITKGGGVFDNEITEQNGNIIRRFWIDAAQNNDDRR